jgi:hypothetical protein
MNSRPIKLVPPKSECVEFLIASVRSELTASLKPY